jgi:hypothetical protein
MARIRILRFSLLTSLLIFTVAAIACAAWVGYRERIVRQQRICEKLVHDLGGDHVLWIDPEAKGYRCGMN